MAELAVPKVQAKFVLCTGYDFMPGTDTPFTVNVPLARAVDEDEDYLQAKEATANSKRTIAFDRERLEIVKRDLGDVKLSTITRSGPCQRL